LKIDIKQHPGGQQKRMRLSGLLNFCASLLYLKKNLQLAAATCPGEVLTKSEARQSARPPQ
jgi:hypothetical protein